MQINYSIQKTFLGQLLIATTQKGICFLGIANADQKLLESLNRTYKKAIILQSQNAQNDILHTIERYLNNNSPLINLPLDLHGTEFQLKVWKELLSINHGTTCTYSKIAHQIGNPKAVRAVARAISQNPVSILIPCHRVIGKNGKLTGYRWGIETKHTLLNLEKSASSSTTN